MEILTHDGENICLRLSKPEFGILVSCLREIVGVFSPSDCESKLLAPDDVVQKMEESIWAVVEKQLKERRELK